MPPDRLQFKAPQRGTQPWRGNYDINRSRTTIDRIIAANPSIETSWLKKQWKRRLKNCLISLRRFISWKTRLWAGNQRPDSYDIFEQMQVAWTLRHWYSLILMILIHSQWVHETYHSICRRYLTVFQSSSFDVTDGAPDSRTWTPFRINSPDEHFVLRIHILH